MDPDPSAPHAKPSPQNEGDAALSKAAAGWSIALVVGIAIATFSAAYNRSHLRDLERAAENTAAGDTRFYAGTTDGAPKLVFEGAPLVSAEKTPSAFPEARMRLAGYTDDATYRLYVPQERENANSTTGGPSWYVKTGPGLFLRMSR
jgi:hypothetical protein